MEKLNYVALLRGINVGGNNKLAMKDLIGLFVAAKCDDVRSFIQSGNILFKTSPKNAARLPEIISEQIAANFGLRIPVVLRTDFELSEVISNNPFLKTGESPDILHVMFLADAPGSEQISTLDPKRSPPGEFIVQRSEVYLKLPKGVGSTKLSNAYFDAKLKTVGTQRNWRTVMNLKDLMSSVKS